jgi:hypothetical protein
MEQFEVMKRLLARTSLSLTLNWLDTAAQVVAAVVVMFLPTSRQSVVEDVDGGAPNCAPAPAVTCAFGGLVTLYFVKLLIWQISFERCRRRCTYAPQVPIADDNKPARGIEYVAGLDNVTLSVSMVQKVHSSEVGNANSPPEVLKEVT